MESEQLVFLNFEAWLEGTPLGLMIEAGRLNSSNFTLMYVEYRDVAWMYLN